MFMGNSFLRNIDMNMKLESLTNMGFGHCALDIECIYIYVKVTHTRIDMGTQDLQGKFANV